MKYNIKLNSDLNSSILLYKIFEDITCNWFVSGHKYSLWRYGGSDWHDIFLLSCFILFRNCKGEYDPAFVMKSFASPGITERDSWWVSEMKQTFVRNIKILFPCWKSNQDPSIFFHSISTWNVINIFYFGLKFSESYINIEGQIRFGFIRCMLKSS